MAVYRLGEIADADLERIMARATAEVFAPALNESVREIVEDVRANGDEAVCRALSRFDCVEASPEQLRVSQEELAAAEAGVATEVKNGIRLGLSNIRTF